MAGYGNASGTLFTEPWPGGKVVFTPEGPGSILPDGSLAMKWPWYRHNVVGQLAIEGRRLDAPAPPLRVEIPCCYDETGFQPSELIFPTEGCWEVTGKAGGAILKFVTLVLSVPFEPAHPFGKLPEGLIQKDTDITGLPQSIRKIYGFPDGGEGELIVETIQGLQEDRALHPQTATQPVTVYGQPAVCVQGDWDVHGQWQAEADVGVLEWTAAGFSYRIRQVGLGLSCAGLLHVAETRPATTPTTLP